MGMEKATSAKAGFNLGALSRLNYNWEKLGFVEIGKLENPEKSQQQTQLTNSTTQIQATLVGGECLSPLCHFCSPQHNERICST